MIRPADVLKMSWRRFSRLLEDVLKTPWKRFEDVFKTSWRRLEDVLKTFLQDVLKTSGQDVLKMSWRRIAKTNILVLTKTSWRRLLKTSSEDVRLRRTYSSWQRRLPKTKTKDVFKTSSLRQMFAGIYPAYIWKNNSKHKKQVIFLMIQKGEGWHYAAVKNYQ